MKQVDKTELETGNSEEYKMKTIQKSMIYIRELESGYLSEFYFLVFWKDYLEEKNT